MSRKTARAKARQNIQQMDIAGRASLYWAISKARNGRAGPASNITTESAISILSDIEELSSSFPSLKERATQLLDEIVGNGEKTYNGPGELIILEFVVRPATGGTFTFKHTKMFQGVTPEFIIIDDYCGAK